MRALTVREPWATLILTGEKTIETRTWSTRHRGDILICGPGRALCIARIADCRPMKRSDEAEAGIALYDGAMAWVLADIRPIKPFPVRGMPGLFTVTLPAGCAPDPAPSPVQ